MLLYYKTIPKILCDIGKVLPCFSMLMVSPLKFSLSAVPTFLHSLHCELLMHSLRNLDFRERSNENPLISPQVPRSRSTAVPQDSFVEPAIFASK